MEELKLLIEMVAGLPALMVWVLVGYLLYKIAVIGSIYGVVRLLIVKGHDALTRERSTEFKVRGGMCITEEVEADLQSQLSRLSTSMYIHPSDVRWLREQINNRK